MGYKMKTTTLGQQLILAVEEAISKKGKGNTVQPKINGSLVRKQLGMTKKELVTIINLLINLL